MEAGPNYELTLLLMLGSRTMIDTLHKRLAALGYDDIRPAHGFAFQRLAPNGATGNELAEFLDITKQAASEMVDYLERHSYVVRQPHPTDRRGKIITLTERGWSCIRETEAILITSRNTMGGDYRRKADGRITSRLASTNHSGKWWHVATYISPNMVILPHFRLLI